MGDARRVGLGYLGGLAGAVGGYVGQIAIVGPLAVISVRTSGASHSPSPSRTWSLTHTGRLVWAGVVCASTSGRGVGARHPASVAQPAHEEGGAARSRGRPERPASLALSLSYVADCLIDWIRVLTDSVGLVRGQRCCLRRTRMSASSHVSSTFRLSYAIPFLQSISANCARLTDLPPIDALEWLMHSSRW